MTIDDAIRNAEEMISVLKLMKKDGPQQTDYVRDARQKIVLTLLTRIANVVGMPKDIAEELPKKQTAKLPVM